MYSVSSLWQVDGTERTVSDLIELLLELCHGISLAASTLSIRINLPLRLTPSHTSLIGSIPLVLL